MGMTMTQKILAAAAGLDKVEAGQLIEAKLDLVLGNDITTPVAINEFEAAGFDRVFDKGKIALVMDHFAPNKDIKAATQCKQCRAFARRFGRPMSVEVEHGTVEVGILVGAIPDMDAVGFAPKSRGAHTTREHLYLETVEPFWQLFCDVLERLCQE